LKRWHHRYAVRRKPSDERIWIAAKLCFLHDLSHPVDTAQARHFQRHVDAGILIHGLSSLMLGAGESPTPLTPSF
jgi:hypothetical protein